MDEHKNPGVKRNLLYQGIYEVFLIVLMLVLTQYTAKVLGAENIGIYSYTYTIACYFVLFAVLGVKNYGNRTIAAVREDPEAMSCAFSNIYAVMLICALVVSAVYVGYAALFTKYGIITIIQSLYLLACFFDIDWFFYGIEKFSITVSRSFIVKLLTAAMIFLFVNDENDLWVYCLILALGSFLGQAGVWVFVHKYVRLVRPSWKEMKRHIKPLIVLFIPSLAISLYKYMDKLMLGTFSTKIQLGYYENAVQVMNVPLNLISAFGTVMLPRMSRMAVSSNIEEIRTYIEKSAELVFCAAYAMAFGMAAVAENFVIVFWGYSFASAGRLIAVMAISIPFYAYACILRTQYLIPQKKDRSYIISIFTGAAVNMILNITLIPKFEALGAAIGTAFAEITVCVLQSIFVRKDLPVLKYVKNSMYFLIVGAGMYFIVRLIGCAGIGIGILMLQILAGIAIYGAFSLTYFVKTKNETFMQLVYKVKGWMRK